MKVILNKGTECEETIETTGTVSLEEVYSGVTIPTDAGVFGIAQRDFGIEVMLNGATVWAHQAKFAGAYDWVHQDRKRP